MLSWFLYVLECEGGSLYTGITNNVEKRFRAHQAGKGARYTRARRPLRVIAVLEFPDRASASRAEYGVKQLRPEEKRVLLSCLPAYIAAPISKKSDKVAAKEKSP
jgi:putative endonuclease